MPTSILLRADQVIEEACLLQRMSLFLGNSGHSGNATTGYRVGENVTIEYRFANAEIV